jgi:hypothetical protein
MSDVIDIEIATIVNQIAVNDKSIAVIDIHIAAIGKNIAAIDTQIAAIDKNIAFLKNITRKAPSEKANTYEDGFIAMGKDNNKYIVSVNKNNVKRWTKVKPVH